MNHVTKNFQLDYICMRVQRMVLAGYTSICMMMDGYYLKAFMAPYDNQMHLINLFDPLATAAEPWQSNIPTVYHKLQLDF